MAPDVKMLASLLAAVVLLLLVVWTYRYVQYRRARRLAQMRWLHFDPAVSKAATSDVVASFEWPNASETAMLLDQPAHRMHMLSPIIEERARDSLDSLGSARRDRRPQAQSFVSYGSIELP